MIQTKLYSFKLLFIDLIVIFFILYVDCELFTICNNDRRVFGQNYDNQTWQIIDSSHSNECEWLITSLSEDHQEKKYINLRLLSIDIDDHSDILYIFDGQSYEKQLIASLTGNRTLSRILLARSGFMLLIRYSANPLKSKFLVEYSITDCPLNCSNHGECLDGRCVCDPSWSGETCQLEPIQQEQCFNFGTIQTKCKTKSEQNLTRCNCPAGYIGQWCNVNIEGYQKDLQWQTAFSDDRIFNGRASHVSVYDSISDTIYTFGGRNFEKIFNDLIAFNVSSNEWFNLSNCDSKQPSPSPLWGHSLNVHNGKLFLFGGVRSNGLLSNELWIYNISNGFWKLIAMSANGWKIPALAFHATVIVESRWLYIFGGQLPNGSLSSNIYRIDLSSSLYLWHIVNPVNVKLNQLQMAGHVAQYYSPYRSVVIFGGIINGINRNNEMSNNFYLYNVDQRVWSILQSSHSSSDHLFKPKERAFHSMLLVADFILIVGGTTYRNDPDDEHRIYAYSLTCQHWIDFGQLVTSSANGSAASMTRLYGGMTSHSIVSRKNVLFLFGGYSGIIHNRVMVLPLPDQLLLPNQIKCNDFCSMIDNCQSCLSYSVNMKKYYVQHGISSSCAWHFKEEKCFTIDIDFNNTYNNFECELDPIDRGLTVLKYYFPPNTSQPDDVFISNAKSKNFTIFLNDPGQFKKRSNEDGGARFKGSNAISIIRILGFIHPLGIASYSENMIRLYLSSSTAHPLLYINETREKLIVMDSNQTSYNFYADFHVNNSSMDDPFLIDLIIKFPIRTTKHKLDYDRIQVNWNEKTSTGIQLKPYSNSKLCQHYATCSSCLSNSACLWCSFQSQCLHFSNLTECETGDKLKAIIVNPAYCPHCLDYRHCDHCLTVASCEWLTSNSICVRRGRFDRSIRNVSQCPLNCEQRSSCETCLDSSDQCLWCPTSQRCITSMSYPTISQYELCNSCNLNGTGDGCSSCLTNFICPSRCVHGHCSGQSELRCECDIGWTGDHCDIDCLCNGHSTCSKGVGQCDHCQHNTQGNHCEFCKKKTFGNATTLVGCSLCQCNGHGHESKGMCHSITGVCYCQNNTEGDHCERCTNGYFGDPRNGGHCFLECQHRSFVPNITFGYFGYHVRDIHLGNHSLSTNSLYHRTNINCLWIFTSFPLVESIGSFVNYYNLLTRQEHLVYPLQLKIFKSMQINCTSSKLIVYDGLPSFLSSDLTTETKLANICNMDANEDVYLTAQSGFLTVIYTSENIFDGFNASYFRMIGAGERSHSKYLIDPIHSNATNQTDHVRNLNFQTIWNTFNEQPDDFPSTFHKVHNYKNKLLVFFGGQVEKLKLTVSIFNLTTKRWQLDALTIDNPLNRIFYSSALVNDTIYLYGGLNHQSNQLFNHLIRFQLGSYRFSLVEAKQSNDVDLPPLMGHTLTFIHSYQKEPFLLLLGGYSPSHGYLDKILLYSLKFNTWKSMTTRGSYPMGMIGHSAVYNCPTNSVYIFGGIIFNESQRATISNTLYILHLSDSSWHRVHSSNGRDIPIARYLHQAISTPNYMIVFSGQINEMRHPIHSTIFVYLYRCDQWITLRKSINNNFCQNVIGSSTEFIDDVFYYYEACSVFTNGQPTRLSIQKINLPLDLCSLYSDDRFQCLSVSGCSFSYHTKNTTNESFCFDRIIGTPSVYHEKNYIIEEGHCKQENILSDCERQTTCADCVATNFETGIEEVRHCQWCVDCHRNGQCLPLNETCESFEYNANSFCLNTSIVDLDHCTVQSCLATDCDKCLKQSKQLNDTEESTMIGASRHSCLWTRKFYPFPNDWSCQNYSTMMYTTTSLSKYPRLKSVPPLSCPARCYRHQTCSLCLDEASGDETGSRECIWSEMTHECLSPTYALLRCENGLCGGLLYRPLHSHCPIPCRSNKKAAECLTNLHCGWCALNGFEFDGLGLCMKGGLFGPLDMTCNDERISRILSTQNVTLGQQISNISSEWHYLNLPKENECRNSHHTCDLISQDCIDLDDGFMCRCRSGYKLMENVCKPICPQGCVFGVCASPNVCRCNFGYIGSDCSLRCRCNGHSICPSSDKLNECLHCHNNTVGQFCERCKPMFVGDPRNGGACQSCFDYCNRHSDKCFNEWNKYTESTDRHLLDVASPIIREKINNTICGDCLNNTEGIKCERCKIGYFKISEDIRDGCRKCKCNGHGFLCNPYNGENCNCKNNTENDRQCYNYYLESKDHQTLFNSALPNSNPLPCWMVQCSKCKDFFYGQPDNGHQCYRHMFIDKEYCFDPNSQEDCLRRPQPLLYGRTVFFALQPRYMNVDIKLIIYVIKGSVDIYISPKHDAFIVHTNETNGFHETYLDKKYVTYSNDKRTYSNDKRTYSNESIMKSIESEDQPFGQGRMLPRKPYRVVTIIYGNNTGTPFYYTMNKMNDFYWIRNVQYRLEITIPYRVHDLRATRFYVMLRGNLIEETDWNANYGFLIFRQDQSRIDLFVFFSVFCSSFVLFLCTTFYLWQVKRFVENRRIQHLHEIELEHLASRPFAKLYVAFDDEPIDCLDNCINHRKVSFLRDQALVDGSTPTSTPAKKGSLFRQLTFGFKETPKIYPETMQPKTNEIFDPKACIRPVSIELTSNECAAVVTMLIDLPGGSQHLTRHRFAAASCLVKMTSQLYQQMIITNENRNTRNENFNDNYK